MPDTGSARASTHAGDSPRRDAGALPGGSATGDAACTCSSRRTGATPQGPAATPEGQDTLAGTVLDPGDPIPFERRQDRRPAGRTITISFPHPRTVMALIALKLARLAARLAAPPPKQPRQGPHGRGPAGGRGGITGFVFGENGLPRAATVAVALLAVLSLTLTSDKPAAAPGGRTTAADQSLPGPEILPGDSLGSEDALGTTTPSDQVSPTGMDQTFSPASSPSSPVSLPAASPPLPIMSVSPPLPGSQPAVPQTKTAVIPPAAPSGPLPAAAKVGQSTASQQLAASGVPARARTSYTNASTQMATLAPGCKIPWTLVAAIGRIESNHGRINRSYLVADGRAEPAIYGVLLDGTTRGTAVIRDSDRGALDANTQFDRAVGPMQFLPGTWQAYALDGDSDGKTDPQDLDDAALTAGRFLCAGATGGADLSTETGQWNAAYRYNRSTSYANLVLALSTTYATGKPATVVNPPKGATTNPATVTITATPVMPAVTTTTTAVPKAPATTPTGLPTTTTTTTTSGETTDPSTTTATTTSAETTDPSTTASVTTPNPSVVVTVTVSVTTVTVTGKRPVTTPRR
ncbi:MAG: hypothetical protein QG622_1834 [Actinomycetota bacterium]|nr:hypothetical protein [Actinomycetota bacterium]